MDKKKHVALWRGEVHLCKRAKMESGANAIGAYVQAQVSALNFIHVKSKRLNIKEETGFRERERIWILRAPVEKVTLTLSISANQNASLKK
jgi:hypothetical protein